MIKPDGLVSTPPQLGSNIKGKEKTVYVCRGYGFILLHFILIPCVGQETSFHDSDSFRFVYREEHFFTTIMKIAFFRKQLLVSQM